MTQLEIRDAIASSVAAALQQTVVGMILPADEIQRVARASAGNAAFVIAGEMGVEE